MDNDNELEEKPKRQQPLSGTTPLGRQNVAANRMNNKLNQANPVTKIKKEAIKKGVVAAANVASPAASAAAQTFLDSKDGEAILDAAANSSNVSEGVQNITTAISEKVAKKYILAASSGVLVIFFIIFLIFCKNADSLGYLDENDPAYNEQYKELYTKIEEVQKDYSQKYGVTIDKELIIATLVAVQDNDTYADSNDKNVVISDKVINQGGVSVSVPKYTTDMANKIELLAKYQIITTKQCSYTSNTYRDIASNDDDESGGNFWSTAVSSEKNYKCVSGTIPISYSLSTINGSIDNPSSGSSYYWNLIDEGFIKEYYGISVDKYSNYNAYMDKVSYIVDNIYSYYFYIKKDLKIAITQCEKYDISCPGVKIVDDYGTNIKTLDEYVLGVLLAEGAEGAYNVLKDDEVALLNVYKSYALLIRTYTLSGTNNCDSVVKENTLNHKYVNPDALTSKAYYDLALRAVNETTGQVIIYENSYVDVDTNIYDKKKQTTSNSGALYLASDKGGHLPYQQIIANYYENDVKIGSNGLCASSAWANYIGYPQVHKSVDDLIASPFYAKGQYGYLGQCPWYAKSRIIEILSFSNLDATEKEKRIESIKRTGGNGVDWYKNPDGKIFKKSTNYLEPRAGTIVAWANGSYGHVGIIEEVYTDGTVLLSEGWRQRTATGGWTYTTGWADVRYRATIQDLDYIKRHGDYVFVGYVYILE